MVSSKSIKNFIAINGLMVSLGYLHYSGIDLIDQSQSQIWIYLLSYLFFLMRNYFFLNWLEDSVNHIELIDKSQNHQLVDKYPYEFHICVIEETLIEVATYYLINPATSVSLFNDLIYFIPLTFGFELIFDFFHYWMHRLGHHRYFYHIHKKHHTHLHPRGITAFYQNPIDLLFTNLLPMYLASRIISLSDFQLLIFYNYKIFVEISGHLGRKLFPASSFSQCFWIPKIFQIELYTEDHDLHHTQFKYNYAKRFSIWDKLFGTFKRGQLERGLREEDQDEQQDQIKWHHLVIPLIVTSSCLIYSLQYFL